MRDDPPVTLHPLLWQAIAERRHRDIPRIIAEIRDSDAPKRRNMTVRRLDGEHTSEGATGGAELPPG